MTTASNDSWFCAEGEQGGLPVIIRGRQFLDQLASPATHPRMLRFVWKYDTPEPSGLPTSDLLERMSTFEDLVFEAMERDHVCVFFCVYTHNGNKEWLAYTSDVQAACETINAVLPHDDPFPISILAEDDPTWHEYQELVAGCLPG